MEIDMSDTTAWLKAADFAQTNPLHCRILDVTQVGKDTIISFFFENGEERKMSLWGKNKKELGLAYGTKSENWAGKAFDIRQEENTKGQNIRTITVPKR